ncbi:hypothetical protein JIN85_00505 [Luteolibacter pohnpeiensis]|uniref:Tetratricopeptide repeat protein n=1 Tax=Luteolibacter pohnpeiensis TaxID=454153 RepID=A0A934S088_9BACT|nr:hypothetical protein [Luteolibacter pohnpeiensis]MBK1880870.1 hypothetical protein [Luteolibacter pohnpeiensis]
MKAFPRAILAFALAASSLPAQNEAPAEPPAKEETKELAPNQKAFLNLPEEQRKEFIKHIQEATRLFQQKRIFEVLDELDKAEAIFKDSPEIYNLRGSCHVEFRAFDKALIDFERANKIAPNNASVEFNIAEVYFVSKDYQKAHEAFTALLAKVPESNIGLSRLVEFKLLLCKQKLGMEDEAAKMAEKYDFMDDSPYYYYSQAAMNYASGNLVKAEEWLARAGRVFRNQAILAPWQDTLVEFGYVKSFYGDDSDTNAAGGAGE